MIFRAPTFPRGSRNIDPKNQNSKIVILCFVVDSGTILAKFHSRSVIDIGLISKISRTFLDHSSELFGARLFQNFHFLEI